MKTVLLLKNLQKVNLFHQYKRSLGTTGSKLQTINIKVTEVSGNLWRI